MTKQTSLRILAALATSALLAVAAAKAHRVEPGARASRVPVVNTPAPTMTGSPLRAQLIAPAASVPTPVAMNAAAPAAGSALAATLAGDDDLAKVDAIEAAVRDGAVAELSVLAHADLARSPGAAPAIIHGLARLAAQDGAANGPTAAHTLSRWLTEERSREGRDAVGNVPNLIEALGALGAAGGTQSVDALVALLENGAESDLALETLTVQQLAALGDPRGKDAIQHFLGRVRARSGTEDAFERELETEAAAAATEALQRL